MIRLKLKNLNLSQIAESGQCFRWKKIREKGAESFCFLIPAFSRVLPVRQEEETFEFYCTREEFDNIWKSYFDLENDYGAFIKNIPAKDNYLKEAAENGSGIRILKQDFFETTVSFIISQNNNISRIKNSIEFLSQNFGSPNRDLNDLDLPESFLSGELPSIYNFPGPESFASYSDRDLLKLFKTAGLGYRDTFLLGFVRLAANTPSRIAGLGDLSYENAMEKLLEIKGIGPKVANCIALFSLHFLGACPVDTWIKKIIKTRYNGTKPDWMNSSPGDHTHCPGGVYQQYVFNYERNLLSQSKGQSKTGV